MDESEFSHLDVLKSPIRLASGAWATTQAVGTSLSVVEVPTVFGAFPTIHKQLLQLYAFYKFTLRFRIVINTTRFHSGKLIAFYDPVNIFLNSLDRTQNIYAATGFPNVKLDAANSNSAEIDVPFENIVSFLTTNSLEDSPPMGSLRILVFNPLQVATGGSDPINFNVFVSAADIQLHLPMRPHVVQFSKPPTFETPLEPNGLSKAIGAVKDVAASASGAWADLKSGNIIGAIKKGFEWFVSDRPLQMDAKNNNMLTTISPPAYMKGIVGGTRLGADQFGCYHETDFSTAPKSDQNIYEICRRPMLVNQFVWSDTDAVDTALTNFAVAPGICNFVPAQPPSNPIFNLMNNTFLSYFATMFEYWRGSLTFTFEFAASNFHAGRLFFAFEPNNTQALLPDVNSTCTDYSNNPYFIFDLEQHKEFSITIPYVASTPRKRCVPYHWISSSQHDYDFLGNLRVIVLDPLVVSEGIASSIPINVYVSAGPDFRFYGPRIRTTTHFLEDVPPPTPSESPLRPNAGEKSDIVLRESQPTTYLVKGAKSVDLPEYFGEEIDDVRDLARRFCRVDFGVQMAADPVRTGLVTVTQPFGSHPDLYYCVPPTIAPTVAAHSFATLISRLYAFWTGSIRWKFIPFTDRSKSLQMTATYTFTTDGYVVPINQEKSGYPAFITNASQDTALEVELPFYSPYTQLLAQDDPLATAYDQGIYTPGYVEVEFTSIASAFPSDQLRVTAYHAVGNDIGFRFLVAPPNTYEPQAQT